MTTIKDTIVQLIGSYSPGGDSISHIDFEWIVAACAFLICLWYVFSLLRTFFCGIMNKRW